MTLDYIQDYFLINQIYNRLYEKNKKFSIVDIIKLIKKNPNYLNFNKQLINLQNSNLRKLENIYEKYIYNRDRKMWCDIFKQGIKKR